MIDLHTHSSSSDGTYSPKELVDHALEKGLSVLALTDHDTVDGLKEASEEAAKVAEAAAAKAAAEAAAAPAPAPAEEAAATEAAAE